MKPTGQAGTVKRLLDKHDLPVDGMRGGTAALVWARNYGEDIALTFLHNQSFFGSEWWWK